MSNFMFENPDFTIIGYYSRELTKNIVKKFKFDFKKIEWREEDVEF